MDYFDELLKKLGLEHLKDDPDALREEVLRKLGFEHLKDDPDALLKGMTERMQDNQQRLDGLKSELGRDILRFMKRNN